MGAPGIGNQSGDESTCPGAPQLVVCSSGLARRLLKPKAHSGLSGAVVSRAELLAGGSSGEHSFLIVIDVRTGGQAFQAKAHEHGAIWHIYWCTRNFQISASKGYSNIGTVVLGAAALRGDASNSCMAPGHVP
jgi:hypothetical protein